MNSPSPKNHMWHNIIKCAKEKKKKKLSQGAFSIVPLYDKGKKLKFLVRFFVF
jgi:hypothetical protein